MVETMEHDLITEDTFPQFEEYEKLALDDLMIVSDINWKTGKRNSFRLTITNGSKEYEIPRTRVKRYEYTSNGIQLAQDNRKFEKGMPVTVKFTDAMGSAIAYVIVWDTSEFEKVIRQDLYSEPFQHRMIVSQQWYAPTKTCHEFEVWQGNDIQNLREEYPKIGDKKMFPPYRRTPTRNEARLFNLGKVEDPPITSNDELHECDMDELFPYQPVPHNRVVKSEVMLVRLLSGELQLVRLDEKGMQYRVINKKRKKTGKDRYDIRDLRDNAKSSWWCVTNEQAMACRISSRPMFEYYDPYVKEWVRCSDPR